MKKLEERHRKVLQEIQDSIPKNLLKNVYRKEKKTPDVEFLVEKLINYKDDPKLQHMNIDPKKVEEFKRLRDMGVFSQEELIPNKDIERIINKYVTRKINEAIKEGRLPPRETSNKRKAN